MEFYHTARRTFAGLIEEGAGSFKRWLGRGPLEAAAAAMC